MSMFIELITRRSNIVLVETAKSRLTWSEVGKKAIILPVNETIQFYQDWNWFIVLDSKHKKHKFALVHFESIVQQKWATEGVEHCPQ